MHIRWFGQSAFLLRNGTAVVIDPFGDTSAYKGRVRFDYPPISGVSADLVLVTHDHRDHNGSGAIGGDPAVIDKAGTHESPVGEVVGVAGEHDAAAGTQRGPNTLFAFELDGVRVAHFGDHGQAELRPEQAAALGEVDLLFVPVGGGVTVDAAGAAEIVARLEPRWVVPMHYRTERVDFLEPVDAFVELYDAVTHADGSEIDLAETPAGVVVLRAP